MAGSGRRRRRAMPLPCFGRIADRFGPDLIHLNSFREAMFDWSVPTVVVAHSCVNSWADACGETDAFTGDEWKVYSGSVQAGLRNADVWVAPTRAFREQLASLYSLNRGGDLEWRGEPSEFRALPKQPFILSAGRLWDKAKNICRTRVGRFGHRMADQDCRAIRVATERRFRSCDVIASSLGEISHAALLGEMESASIFVSPALYEPFGLSVLEAASAGCALMLSDIPTFRELWDGAAMFFDPRDPDRLLRCLRSLCRDDVQRVRLQRAAAKRAQHYPLSNTVERLPRPLRILAGGSGRSIDRRAVRGDAGMKAVLFCHAFTSCWNNGNAHFLRGIARELARTGHQVVVCEPAEGWSRSNALSDGGEAILREAESLLPPIQLHRYRWRRRTWMTFCTVPISRLFMNGIRRHWLRL